MKICDLSPEEMAKLSGMLEKYIEIGTTVEGSLVSEDLPGHRPALLGVPVCEVLDFLFESNLVANHPEVLGTLSVMGRISAVIIKALESEDQAVGTPFLYELLGAIHSTLHVVFAVGMAFQYYDHLIKPGGADEPT